MISETLIWDLEDIVDSDVKMPTFFVGHGSPLNAIEDNEFSRAWTNAGQILPKPKAVLCISAHWETPDTQVTGVDQPPMIYDFYGFPKAFYEVRYSPSGSPGLARVAQKVVHQTNVRLDTHRGLDHGAWSVLCRMFPKADIPIIQLSLDRTKEPSFHSNQRALSATALYSCHPGQIRKN
jgi:4,5-DOPA dioxygenase extradiol